MNKKLFLLPILSLALLVGCTDGTITLPETDINNSDNNNNNQGNNENPGNGSQEEPDDNKNNHQNPDPQPIEKTYTITWNDYDGSLLSTTSVKENVVPTYSSTPTRSDTETATYSFSGWVPSVVAATADATYTATYTENQKPEALKLSTIAEVRTLCETLTGLNAAGIKVDMGIPVRIQGWAFHKMTLVKTTKSFGFDLSYPNKVFLGDSTGFIACASNNTDHSFYNKVANYAGGEKSKYEIFGYASMYMNQPEIYVPDNSSDETHFTYNQNLSVSCDFSDFTTVKTIDEYYEGFTDKCYNCAGHGYKDIVTINDVSIVDVIDADTFIGTNGDKVIKLKKGIATLSKGGTYDLTGLVQTNDFIPSINLFSAKATSATYTDLKESSAISCTIEEFTKKFSSLPYSDGDTDRNLGNTIKQFQYAYKLTGYVSAYNKSEKLYVTLENAYNSSKEYPTRENSICVRKAISFKNNNCWNTTEDKIIKYSCIGDYFNENISVSLYVTPILYENMTYSKTKYHELKNYIFESLVPVYEDANN